MSDKKTPHERPPMPDEWGHEITGPMRRVVHQELETKLNGSLERLEKGQRWTKAILYFLGLLVTIVGAVVATDHWVNSLATKSELDAKMVVMGAKIDGLVLAFHEMELILAKKTH
jgi:hypothetical protein